MEVSAKLLALAASVSWDGGEGVLRALRQILREDAPFDAGEVALQRSPGFQRWTLTDDDEPLAADDLLELASRADAPIRIDDMQEPGFAPHTRERMARRGMRSCLALPLCGAGGPEGVVVVAREHGWAFAGVSLPTLWPLASMAGLCLARAIALTVLRKEAEAAPASLQLREQELQRRAAAECAELRQAAERARAEQEAAEATARDAREGLAAARSQADSLRLELETLRRSAEERRGEAEAEAVRWRAEAERLAAELLGAPAGKRRRRSGGSAEPAASGVGPEPEPSRS
jgi:GAF domain